MFISPSWSPKFWLGCQVLFYGPNPNKHCCPYPSGGWVWIRSRTLDSRSQVNWVYWFRERRRKSTFDRLHRPSVRQSIRSSRLVNGKEGDFYSGGVRASFLPLSNLSASLFLPSAPTSKFPPQFHFSRQQQLMKRERSIRHDFLCLGKRKEGNSWLVVVPC